MKLKVIGSNSKGNAYILETPTGSLLLDAGVPFGKIMEALGFYLLGIRGALITHSHKDHSGSINDLLKYCIDVYAPLDCMKLIKPEYHHRFIHSETDQQFTFGDFTILPIEARHDVPCLAYLIQYRPTGEKLLYATDTYYLKNKFIDLNYILIECNYCLDILKTNIEAGLIPESLKNRLLESHFSLDNVKGFLKANDLSEVRKIVLIHLSDGNSDAARMVREIKELTGKDVEVAETGKEINLELYPF